MNTIKKTRIENMLSTYQELTDWADKEVIPKLYKSGVIDFDKVDSYELIPEYEELIVKYTERLWRGEYEEHTTSVDLEWYYDPETLNKYIQDYLKKQKEKQLQEEENNKKLKLQKYLRAKEELTKLGKELGILK